MRSLRLGWEKQMYSKTITRIHCAHYTYLVLFIRFDTYCQPPPTQIHTTYHSQRQTPPQQESFPPPAPRSPASATPVTGTMQTVSVSSTGKAHCWLPRRGRLMTLAFCQRKARRCPTCTVTITTAVPRPRSPRLIRYEEDLQCIIIVIVIHHINALDSFLYVEKE